LNTACHRSTPQIAAGDHQQASMSFETGARVRGPRADGSVDNHKH
jgi:hypothetical protein